jgi:hypothetical protein
MRRAQRSRSIIDEGRLARRSCRHELMSSRTEMSSVPASNPPPVTRWSTAALLLGWALVVLVLVYFLELRPALQTNAALETVPTVQAGFPAPMRGAIVYSRQLRVDALAVAIKPGASESQVQASVVGPDGAGTSGLSVKFVVQGSIVSARSCGAGCYRAAVATESRPRTIDVVVEGDSSVRWHIALPKEWPPRDARALVASAERAWRSLRSVSFEETLASGPSRVVASAWRAQAPDRLTYRIRGGSSAVVIGKRRWDKAAGRPWKKSPQFPLRQPVPPWVGSTNAHVVATAVVRGRSAAVVTFFDPKTPSWLRVVVDRATHRTLDLRMVATAHFMHDRYHSFDETSVIRPPAPVK